MRLVEIRRVSTEEQARDDRSGLDRQADSNRATGKRVGATLIDPPIVITDVCRENFIDTPEWRTIRALIADPDVHIVVDMQDRIVGALEGIPILIECKRTNTSIYHSQGVTDPTTLAGQVLATFTAIFAGNELHTIRHRAQGGKEAKRREGIFASADISLPIGIAYVRIKGQRAGRWTHNERAPTVKEVFRLVVEEGLRNWTEVARRAGAPSNVAVRNMLTNPIYAGWWIIDERRLAGPTPIKPDGRRRDRAKIKRAPEDVFRHRVFRPKGEPPEPGDDREEALIDDATWDAVQEIVEAKSRDYFKPREPKGNTRFIYTGRLWCAGCGDALWSKTRRQPSGRRDYYVCRRTQVVGERCSLKYLRRDEVNAAIDRLFAVAFADERFLAALVEDGLRGDVEDFSSRIAERSKDARRLRTQRERLLDLYLDPDSRWGRSELDQRAAKLDADIEGVERELRRLRQAQEDNARANALDSVRDILSTLSEFEFWSPRQKRDLLARFFPRIEISAKGVERVVVALPRVGRIGRTEIPLGDAGVPLTLTVKMTWEQLVPKDKPEMTEFGLPMKPLYTRGDLCTILGLTEHQLKDRLAKGLIPEAKHHHCGKRAWTLDELREVVTSWKARELPYRWGLPKKTFYTTGDAASILGVTWEQLRYAIDGGRVTDCEGRDEQGHRRWTEAEVERAVGEFDGEVVASEEGAHAGK